MTPHGKPESKITKRVRQAREQKIVREYRKLASMNDEHRDARIRRWVATLRRYGVDVRAVLERHNEEWP